MVIMTIHWVLIRHILTIAQVEPQSLGWFDLRQPEDQPFSGEIAANVQQEFDALDESTVAYIVHLDEEQRLWLIDPRQNKLFKLRQVPEKCDPKEDPFSGIH